MVYAPRGAFHAIGAPDESLTEYEPPFSQAPVSRLVSEQAFASSQITESVHVSVLSSFVPNCPSGPASTATVPSARYMVASTFISVILSSPRFWIAATMLTGSPALTVFRHSPVVGSSLLARGSWIP